MAIDLRRKVFILFYLHPKNFVFDITKNPAIAEFRQFLQTLKIIFPREFLSSALMVPTLS